MFNNKNFINQHETINEDTTFIDNNFDNNEDLNNEILDNYYNNIYEDDNNDNDNDNQNDNNINISFEKLMTNNNQSKSDINEYDIIDNNKAKIKYKKEKKKYLRHITKEALIGSILFTILSLPATNKIISLIFADDSIIGFIKIITFKLMLFLLIFVYIARCI
jgi:hypothetical protein